jgi:hypothetical protein
MEMKRQELTSLILGYARISKIKPAYLYGTLYAKFSDRIRLDIQAEAKRYHQSVIAYLEQKGLLDKAVTLAKEIFQ